MIASILAVIGLSLTGLALMCLVRAENDYRNLQVRLREMAVAMKDGRIRLRAKLNRNLALMKQAEGEPIPRLTFQKRGVTLPVLLPSDTIYSLAEDGGFGLSGTCEGNGDCGLCAVAVISGADRISPVTAMEKEILEKINYPAGARLSCQARVLGDVTVNFMDVQGQT